MPIQVAGKQISSDKIVIKDVFGEDMWFNIPDYQRPYVWGDDQLSNLLDDISHAAINTPDSQYFLGSLVLHVEKQVRDNTEFLENIVLDGQQRLTTLYIMQAVIRDLSDEVKRKKTCADAIFQEGNPDDGIPERMRIEFAIRSEVENFVNKYIKPEGGTDAVKELSELSKGSADISVKNMASAVLFIRKWFLDEDNTPIGTIFPYLRKNVLLVYVASGELEDAFRLFTVLNDRGIKLRNSDILKAQNLKAASSEKKKREYAIFWEELEGELGEDFDLFLSYIRTILVKEKARQSLLKEFDENIYSPKKFNVNNKKYEPLAPLLNRGDDTFELIKEYKKHYDQIFGGNNFHLNNNWAFDNLVSLMNDTALSDIWIPPLLNYRKNFGDKKIFEFLVLLANKFSGDWISRETPTTRIDAMNSIIKKIESVSASNNTEDVKIKLLFDADVFLFNGAEFIMQLDINSVYGRRYARFLLRKIDFLLDAPLYQQKRTDIKEMSVEHVLPQTPGADSQWVKDFSTHEQSEWTHKLGNLVLISRRKNAGQGRLDFIDKKEKYFKNSIESFPNSLKVMVKNKWTPADVKFNHESHLAMIKNHYSLN